MSDPISQPPRPLIRALRGARVIERAADIKSRAGYALRHRASQRALDAWRDRHAGETCFIIGNGPSLNQTNLGLLRDHFTFGLNRINLAFDRMGFTTSCLVCINRLVLEQSGSEIASVAAPKFFSVVGAQHIPAHTPDVVYLRPTSTQRFSRDPVRAGVWEGATVTFVAMQLAHWFGFHRVVLVGVDHSFSSKGPAHALVTSQGPDSDHFDPRYFAAGYRWQLPDLETSEIAYAAARSAFEEDGREIVDATVGGKLQIFPKATLEDLF